MNFIANELLEELTNRAASHMELVKQWKELPLENLKQRSSPTSWNALECIAHLNLYGDFYIPEIESCMHKDSHRPDTNFQSGRLGNYFAKGMLPKENTKKIKTFKDKNPLNWELDIQVLEAFIDQQRHLISLLKLAENKNLNKIKTGISITKWIKLRLGDTFRIVINHNERHIRQAENAIEYAKIITINT